LYAGEAAASPDGLFPDLPSGAAQQHQNTRSSKQSQIVRVKCLIGSPATDQEVKGSLAGKESFVVAIRAFGLYAGSQQVTANIAKMAENVDDPSLMPRHVLAISRVNSRSCDQLNQESP
jgi:hypothetical protein